MEEQKTKNKATESKILKTKEKKIELKTEAVSTTITSTSAPAIQTTKKSQSAASKGLIAVIRIHGEVKVKPGIVNTLFRLRLRRKYTCCSGGTVGMKKIV